MIPIFFPLLPVPFPLFLALVLFLLVLPAPFLVVPSVSALAFNFLSIFLLWLSLTLVRVVLAVFFSALFCSVFPFVILLFCVLFSIFFLCLGLSVYFLLVFGFVLFAFLGLLSLLVSILYCVPIIAMLLEQSTSFLVHINPRPWILFIVFLLLIFRKMNLSIIIYLRLLSLAIFHFSIPRFLTFAFLFNTFQLISVTLWSALFEYFFSFPCLFWLLFLGLFYFFFFVKVFYFSALL